MARLAPLWFLLALVGAACSAKPKDGAPGGPKGIGDVDGPQAPPDAAPEAAPAPAATAASTSRDIEVRGTIETADDLEVIAPVATTLTLVDGEAAETAVPYSVECATLDAQRKTCSAPVEPTAPRAGTFALSCPGMGAASIACNLRRGTTLDAIILGDATLLNVSEGIVDLKLASAANQLPKGSLEPTSTALVTVEELAARFAAKPTDLSASFTGNWYGTWIDEPAGPTPELAPYYFHERIVDGSQRKVEIWYSQAEYDQCHAAEDDRLDQHFLLDGKRFEVDETSAETLTASLETIAAAFFDSEVERVYKATRSFGYKGPCTEAACAPRTDGPFKGRPRDEVLRRVDHMQKVLQEAKYSSLETLLESCPRQPDDLYVCRGEGAGVEFCFVLRETSLFFGRSIDLETLAPSSAPPDFTECLGDAPNALNPLCFSLSYAIEAIGVTWRADRGWTHDANVELSGYLSNVLPLCPDAARSEPAKPADCRAEFLAADASAQNAAIIKLAHFDETIFHSRQICPEVEGVDTPTPDAGVAAHAACRQSYLSAGIDERRRRLLLAAYDFSSGLTGLACMAPKRAEALIAAVGASCLRVPFRLSTYEPLCERV